MSLGRREVRDGSHGPDARRALEIGLPFFLRVQTGSMRPLLRPGCVARVVPCTADDLVRGDIVCVDRGPGPLQVHRYVGSYRRAGIRCVVTRGDRCVAPDPPVSAERLLGRVASTPWLGFDLRLDHRAGRAVGRALSLAWAAAARARRLAPSLRAPDAP